MRLTFKLDNSVRASVPDRQILYFVDSTIHTVDELIDKLRVDFGLPSSPVLSVDDFVVFTKSPIQILREEDVIVISVKSQLNSKSTSSATSSSSEDDTSEDKAGKGQSTTSSSSEDELMETDSSDNSESEEDNSSSTGEALNGTRNAPPDSPLNYWHKLTIAPRVSEVLMYKIVEVNATWEPVVSPWRYGVVVDVDLEGKEADSVITLTSWPDPQVHPDPRETISSSEESEEDENANFKKQRTLEVPRSEYSENGQLTRQLSQFVDIRVVDAETVEKYKKDSVDFGIKKRKQDKKTEEPNGIQRSSKVAKKGVAGVLSYLRNV